MTSTNARTGHGYGWLPDLPDHRDLEAAELAQVLNLTPVPAGLRKFSLRDQFPEPPYDQGQLGSCTGNGWAGAVQFRRKALGLEPFRPSRLFIYYFERVLLGTVGQDSGANIRDGAKVVNQYGAPSEDGWAYDITKFTQEPPPPEETAGLQAQITQYARVNQNLDQFKLFIYNGFPVVKGFTVYESFESADVAKTGRMPIPQKREQVLGGHCTDYMGWDDDAAIPGSTETGAFEDRNSWGATWGDGGYYWTPYVVAMNRGMSSDFWVAEIVEAPQA